MIPHEEKANGAKVPCHRIGTRSEAHLRNISTMSDRPAIMHDLLSLFSNSYMVAYRTREALRKRLGKRAAFYRGDQNRVRTVPGILTGVSRRTTTSRFSICCKKLTNIGLHRSADCTGSCTRSNRFAGSDGQPIVINALNSVLYQRPEPFDGLRVNIASNVDFSRCDECADGSSCTACREAVVCNRSHR
jgi:hypothetical protein